MQNYSNTPGQNPEPGKSVSDKIVKWACLLVCGGLVLAFALYTVLHLLGLAA